MGATHENDEKRKATQPTNQMKEPEQPNSIEWAKEKHIKSTKTTKETKTIEPIKTIKTAYTDEIEWTE